MSVFLQGLIIGLSIAIPVGPIGMLCLRRSLTEGRLAGLVSGMGAATADALYGVIAAFGISIISDFLLAHRTLLQLGGGLFLIYLGISICRAKPAVAAERPAATSLFAAYLSTLALTLANPTTIVAFIGIFAGVGVVSSQADQLAPYLMVLGVFVGSAIWWVILAFSAAALAPKLQQGGQRYLNLGSGVLIAAIGVWQLGRLLV